MNTINGKNQRGNKTSMQGAGSAKCIVKSSKIVGLAPILVGNSWTVAPMDPINGNVYTTACSRIAGCYEFYRIRSLAVTVVPTGGLNAVGSMTIAFVNNPELQLAAILGSGATRETILNSEQGLTVYPFTLGGTKRLDMSRLFGRKMFSNNFNIASTVDDFDRTVQTVLMLRGQGVDGAIPCMVRIDSVIEFSGLARASDFTLLNQLDGTYTTTFDEPDDAEWPDQVALRRRSGKIVTYVKPPVAKPSDSQE